MAELTGKRTSSPFLASYYSRVFPHDDFCRWLTYNGHVSLPNRELVFECGIDGTPEHQSFADAVALKNQLRRLCPDKIEVGAVYSEPPRHEDNVFVEKEFVVDIDLAKYDDVSCCSGNDKKEVCSDCYELLTFGMKIIDRSLRVDQGFNHILWVYHTKHMYGWVCDKKARLLPGSYRRELIKILQHAKFFKAVKSNGRCFNLGMEEPILKRDLLDIRPRFQQILMQKNLFEDTRDKMNILMRVLPNDIVRGEVHSLIRRLEGQNSCQKFKALNRLIKSKSKMEEPHWYDHANLMDQVAIWYIYPRLNQDVSFSVCLPLIAPFTMNADTGEIAIPVDVDEAKDMNPVNAPTIERVMKEVEPAMRDGQDVEDNTCLKPSLKIFREFLTNLFDSDDQQEDLPNTVNYQEPEPDPPRATSSIDMRACHQQ